MATIDADGTVHLLGRGSQCINTGGEKVYPEEVEAVLKAAAGVHDAVVVGVPDERYGQRVVAIVAPAVDAPSPALDVLQAHCREYLAGYKIHARCTSSTRCAGPMPGRSTTPGREPSPAPREGTRRTATRTSRAAGRLAAGRG